MAKRTVGNGEGSLYYSKKEGKWIFQYYYNGKQKKMRQKQNERVKDFKARVTEIKSSLNNDSYIDSNNTTILKLAQEIVQNKHNRNLIKDSTYNRNLYLIDMISKSNINKIEIQKASYLQLQNFLDEQKDYSQSTIDKLYQLLKQVFIEAQKRDIIIKNPMSKTIKPKSNKLKKKIEAFSIDEQKAFISQLENEKYKDIFIIAIYTGMRMR